MGLDMNLYAKRFMWYNEDELKGQVAAPFNLPAGMAPKEVSVEAAYWRKSNQIHKWFVDNVQNGEDDCGTYYVSREEIQNLIDTCNEVLQDHSKAESLLPTQSGFFYGDTEYDDYYFQDLNDTATNLTRALTLDSNWEFEYRSSW